MFELRYFLNHPVKGNNNKILSSKTIKFKIIDLIAKENKEKPLTDQEIAGHLKKNDIFIARRTINKYRKHLKILSSQSRRE